MGYLATAVGGFVIVAIIAAIVERLAFKAEPPTRRAAFTVLTAFVIVSIIAGLGFADGGPFAWWASLFYIPGAVLVWLWYRHRYSKAWSNEADVFE